MNSKGHFIISMIKSLVRIAGCAVAFSMENYVFGFFMLFLAEGLGVAEELVDHR